MSADAALLDDTDLLLLGALQHDASTSNQALAEQLGLSPATCHRRVRRLKDEGYIERQVTLVAPHKMAAALGWGLQALVEISLDVQTQEALDTFEARAVADPEVQQCWRVSPGPDFILVVQVVDMPAFQDLSRRLFTQDNLVRNVRSFFAVKRAKFGAAWPLPTTRPAGQTPRD